MLNDDTARAVRRHQKRKVENIVTKTYQAFHDEIAVYGTLNAEEIMTIGLNLIRRDYDQAVATHEGNDPQKMRESVVYQIAALVGDTPNEQRN